MHGTADRICCCLPRAAQVLDRRSEGSQWPFWATQHSKTAPQDAELIVIEPTLAITHGSSRGADPTSARRSHLTTARANQSG